ncbi:MAG: thioredoxin domain-containing protein [Bdellovibrionales bacterium]|nr:thioredoxin domain-containing protein [Bdellovibrionales bacterium]
MANALAKEKSLYLQQHANNPVNWFPWGEEAFKKAREENKPLLVSIGYSTCHWCHVMEHESFEDPEVAAYLNAHFVAIKVDREEHPDVDENYMEAVQALTQRGGWPLNMFTLPTLKPFFGGTYFPRVPFLSVLQQIQKLWTEEPERIRLQAQHLAEHMASGNTFNVPAADLPLDEVRARQSDWYRSLLEHKLRSLDPVWGGFGPAPKFPRPHAISALLRAAELEKDAGRKTSALFAVSQTLRGMAYGGLRDHLRGGFHRYSTDDRWLVPHFEKMLYDQALLVQVYSEAYRIFREDFYADIVAETLGFLEAEMRLASGGFAAAQDADSEGEEGKYYVWTHDELTRIFVGEKPELVAQFYRVHSVTPGGNWEGRNVLASPMDLPWAEWRAPEMVRMRAQLLRLRGTRVAPLRDEKNIVAWNALMASSLAQASLNLVSLPELSEKLLASAQITVGWLLSVAGKDHQLPRVVYSTANKGEGYLEDYAAVVEALQFLGVREGSAERFDQAAGFLSFVQKYFRTPEQRLLSRRMGYNAELPFDKLEFQDGATPAAVSLYVGSCLRQALVDSNSDMAATALRDMAPLQRVLNEYPFALPYLLLRLDVVNSFVLKAPENKLAEVRGDWSKRPALAGSPLLQPSKGSKFEACDLQSCFASTATLAELWSVVAKRG